MTLLVGAWQHEKRLLISWGLVLVWIPIGRERGASFANQSQSVVMQNQSERSIWSFGHAVACWTRGMILA